jgi:hypothetical protein
MFRMTEEELAEFERKKGAVKNVTVAHKERVAKAAAKAVAHKDEHDLQVQVVKWWDEFAPLYGYLPEDLFAIPNGGERHIAVAAKLKAEGVRAGIPDMMLAIPMVFAKVEFRHGLFIEHKMPGNGLSEKQSAASERLARRGYRAVVSYSAVQTQLAIMDYLQLTGNPTFGEKPI